jgi:bifunctional UDP-N-acetylglucosamine pyrophosphorylase/glucosamine-1-phosphate N-acetyltransferase
MHRRKLGAIILAAGKGKRMKSGNVNKNSILLNGKPLVAYPVELLQHLRVEPIIIVVGHAPESIENALLNFEVTFVKQTKRLGTGHAVGKALPLLSDSVSDILVLYGDDAYMYTEKTIKNLLKIHEAHDSALTFLTITVDNPAGLGRVIRNKNGDIIDIIEEKDASEEQKKIMEINPNCYVFNAGFLRKYVAKIQKSGVTGEYYLPALIKLAHEHGEKIKVVDGGKLPWRGVNTPEDLHEAKNILSKVI